MASRAKLRVVIVDDSSVVRAVLRRIVQQTPDIEVAGEAGDGVEAIEQASRLRPDTVVMDISMPRMNGIEATRRISASLPEVRVIGLSMHEADDMARAMTAAGAVAFLSKDGPTDELLAAIRRAADARG